MASYVIRPADLDVSAITYGALRVSENKTKSIQMSHDRKPIVLQTPEMYVPAYGLGTWENPDGSVQYSIDLSFKDKQSRPALQTFFDKLSQLDEKLVKDAVENGKTWFGKNIASTDVAEAIYTKHIRYPKDKETQEITDRFPPTFKLKLPKRDGKFIAEIYDKNGDPLSIEEVNTKNAKVIAQIQCTGIWIIAGKFGASFKVLKLMVTPQEEVTGPKFLSVEEDKIAGDMPGASGIAQKFLNASIADAPPDEEKLVESSDDEPADEFEVPSVSAKRV